MVVKVSNTMSKALGKILKNSTVSLVKMTPDKYSVTVDYDLFRHEQDYDIKTGLFKALMIDYNPELYALPRYLTTRDLVSIFRNSDKTYEGFCEGVQRFCEV